MKKRSGWNCVGREEEGQLFVFLTDPAELSRKVVAAPLDDAEQEDEELAALRAEVALMQRDHFARMLDLIPQDEADMVELRLARKSEADIGKIFELSQAAVSYTLHRALQRFRWLAETDYLSFCEDSIRRDLTVVCRKPCDMEILLGMFRTTCQTEVAKSTGVPQGRVRSRLRGMLDRMKLRPELERDHKLYASMFRGKNGFQTPLHKVPVWTEKNHPQKGIKRGPQKPRQ